MAWFLIAVRQEVKRIDNSVVAHELELAKKNATYRPFMYNVGSLLIFFCSACFRVLINKTKLFIK